MEILNKLKLASNEIQVGDSLNLVVPNKSGTFALTSDIPELPESMVLSINDFTQHGTGSNTIQSGTINGLPINGDEPEEVVFYKQITKNQTSSKIDVMANYPDVKVIRKNTGDLVQGVFLSSGLNKLVHSDVFFSDIRNDFRIGAVDSTLFIVFDKNANTNNIEIHISNIKYKTVNMVNPLA